MAEPTNAELAKLIQTLAASVSALQGQVAALQQERPAAASFSGSRGSGNGEQHGDRPPRFQKLDFPKFDGKSDPLAFLNRCESYFHQQRIVAEEQVWMASYNLEGGAQMWFIQVQQDEGTPSWRRFSELLNLRFGPPIRSNPLGELMACKRTGTVAEYQDRFEALLPRAGTLSEPQRVQAFTAGLQPPLSIDVELHNPQSLVIAMSLARKLELREQYAAVAPPFAPPNNQQQGLLPAPPPCLALPAPPPAPTAAATTVTVEGRPVRRLSMSEMEERRRLGLCFNCNEKFGRGHNQVCQRLFWLDLAAADDDNVAAPDNPDTTAAPLLLHAISGVHTSNTMQPP
jgi:hypothetical protein